MKKERFSLNDVPKILAKPVFEGENAEHIWTGLVDSERINSFMIENDALRIQFTKLTRDLEQNVRSHRTFVKQMKEKKFGLLTEEQVRNQIIDLQNKINKSNIDVIRFLADYGENEVDVHLYFVNLCRKYEELKAYNPDEISRMDKETIKVLENLSQYVMQRGPFSKLSFANGRYTCYQFLSLKQEKLYEDKKEKNSKALMETLEKVAETKDLPDSEKKEYFIDVFTVLNMSELDQLFESDTYADTMSISVFKNFLLKKGYTHDQIEAMNRDEMLNLIMTKLDKGEDADIIEEVIIETIKNGVGQLDFEKLMLVTMAKQLAFIENMANDEEISLNEFIEESRITEELVKRLLELNVVTKKAKGEIGENEKDVEITLKDIERKMKNFTDGIYMSELVEKRIKTQTCVDPDAMASFDDEMIKKFEYKEDEKVLAMMINFENLKRLYSLGNISKKDIQICLSLLSYGIDEATKDFETEFGDTGKTLKDNAHMFFKNIVKNDIFTPEELGILFERKIITLEMISTLDNDEETNNKMKSVFTKEMLLEQYKFYVETYQSFMEAQKNEDIKQEELEELKAKLNYIRNIKNHTKDLFMRYNPEFDKNELLEFYYFDMEVTDETILQESIKNMYEDGLVDLENIIHLDKDYVVPMLDSLSLDDANKVKQSMSFEDLGKMLDKIFDNKEISDERKFIIIMNLLGGDTKQEKEAREFYLSLLEFDSLEKKTKHKRKKDVLEDSPNGGTSKESNKYIYPDIVKWKFYKGLDKDVRVTRFLNGYVEFASSKLGVRIIEKYYDGDKPAYGTATYILPEEKYQMNQGELITESPKGKTLESAVLKEVTPKRDRIAHRTQSTDRTWMDDIVKYFDVDYERENDSRYTQEELKDLQAVVEKFKRQYERI